VGCLTSVLISWSAEGTVFKTARLGFESPLAITPEIGAGPNCTSTGGECCHTPEKRRSAEKSEAFRSLSVFKQTNKIKKKEKRP